MNTISDRRVHSRYLAYWKILNKNDNNDDYGYIVDLSEGGAKAFISDKVDLDESLVSVQITPPGKLNLSEVEFECEPVWVSNKEDQKFYEVGFRFKNMTSERKDNLDKLISFFCELNLTN